MKKNIENNNNKDTVDKNIEGDELDKNPSDNEKSNKKSSLKNADEKDKELEIYAASAIMLGAFAYYMFYRG